MTKMHNNRLSINGILAAVLSVIISMLTVSSCSSSRHAVKSVSTEGMSRELAAAGENVNELGAYKSVSIAKAIAKSYTPWQKVSLKGKVKMDGLPIALNIKIYMERTHSVIMSLSAPILGEVGRVEITPDSALIVNKRAKTYCKEPLAAHLATFGASITDIQDLIMGRVFMLGYGSLTEGNASQVEVSEGASDTWILTPKQQHPRAQYGFTLYHDGLMMMAAAFTPDEQYLASAEYSHDVDKTDIDLSFKYGKKSLSLNLSLSAPDYTPEPLTTLNINPKWNKVGFRQLLKSFS